ncbi:MAG: peptidylprolyl isomerase [Photobacterium aquimaris]|nr:peptidylprolyl isomerase [Photobacterium aquimaris]
MKIEEACVVSIHYTLTDSNGEEIDCSKGKQPLEFLNNANSFLPGLEKALQGKEAGDNLQVTVEPEDGHGQINSELIFDVPIEEFSDQVIELGMQFKQDTPDGHTRIVTVDAVDEKSVKVNGNHPFAGRVLHFDVTVNSVREGTDKDVEQLLTRF